MLTMLVNKFIGETWMARISHLITLALGIITMLNESGYKVGIPALLLWLSAHLNVGVQPKKE